MKKLKLNLKNVGEILTREQLKQVYGGSGGSGDCDYYSCQCYQYPGAWTGCYSNSAEVHRALMDYCPNYGWCQ